MTSQSRAPSPTQSIGNNILTLSRGNCSAYAATAKTDENWTTIADRTERRRIQNRIAQRAYRLKLKERLQLLESRAASLSVHSHAHSPLCQSTFTEEGYYNNISSNTSVISDDRCHQCSHSTTRSAPATPPQYYSHSHSAHLNSPHLHAQTQDLMSFYPQLQLANYQQPHGSDSSMNFAADTPSAGLGFPYLPTYTDDLLAMNTDRYNLDNLPATFLPC